MKKLKEPIKKSLAKSCEFLLDWKLISLDLDFVSAFIGNYGDFCHLAFGTKVETTEW